MTSRSTSPERFNFSALGEAHPLPNLLEIQRDSFDLFMKQGLREAFEAISPITDFTGRLSLELEFDPAEVHGRRVPPTRHHLLPAHLRAREVLELRDR